MGNDIIKTNNKKLTLWIDGKLVTAEKFINAVKDTFGIINDVSKKVIEEHGEKGTINWVVTVEEGSLKVNFAPKSDKIPLKTIYEACDIVYEGINSLEHDSKRPNYFLDSPINKVGKLANIIDLDKKRIERVSIIKDNSDVLDLSHRAVANVQKLITKSEAYGSIEGKLRMVSEIHGYRFNVYDELTSKAIECHFENEILDKVIKAFGKRVMVSGLIRYNEYGKPRAVYKIKKLEILSKKGLPSIYDVKGILGAK